MPKILKVKVGRTLYGGVTKYSYPQEYDKSKIKITAFESCQRNPDRLAEIDARGGKDEFFIGAVSDADADGFLASDDIVELSQEEANTLGESYLGQIIKTTNQNAVNLALAKYALSQELSDADKKALDPDDATPGLSRSISFTDRLANALGVM